MPSLFRRWMTDTFGPAARRPRPRPLQAAPDRLEDRTAPAVVATAEAIVNQTTAGNQRTSREGGGVASAADGRHVVVWGGNGPGDNSGVFARLFNADGTPATGEFLVNQVTNNNQSSPSVALDADGDFVVAWESYAQDDTGEYGVYARRYDALGNPRGNEFRVNQITADDQDSPSVALDADGDFVIAWRNRFEDGAAGTNGVYARRFDAAGNALGDEFRVNQTTADAQVAPAVSSDADGDFVVAWQSYGQDGSGDGVYVRRYSAAGAALGDEFRVNQTTAAAQVAPAV
jgi:hypothetical protein